MLMVLMQLQEKQAVKSEERVQDSSTQVRQTIEPLAKRPSRQPACVSCDVQSRKTKGLPAIGNTAQDDLALLRVQVWRVRVALIGDGTANLTLCLHLYTPMSTVSNS